MKPAIYCELYEDLRNLCYNKKYNIKRLEKNTLLLCEKNDSETISEVLKDIYDRSIDAHKAVDQLGVIVNKSSDPRVIRTFINAIGDHKLRGFSASPLLASSKTSERF